jgi:hypothetical protein
MCVFVCNQLRAAREAADREAQCAQSEVRRPHLRRTAARSSAGTHAHMHIHTYIYTHAYTHIYIHTCIHTHIYTRMHTHIFICTRSFNTPLSLSHTHVHIHTYTHTYPYPHSLTYTHTHTHTHTQCERTIPELSRFPVLRQKLYKCVGELLRRRMRPTKQMIQHIVQIELGMCVCVCLYV